MTEAQEVRARAKALRERREELEKALAGAAGPGARPLRLELARVKEELVDCARRLKELMPSHKVRCRTTWAGVDGWQWDRFQYQTWAELEGAGEQDGPTELDRMRLAVRLARERAVTDKQGEYLAQVEGGKKAAQVARALEVRFVSTSWHSGSQEVKCLVATGMAQVMDALFDDLDDRCMARLEEITVEQVDRKLSGGPCPGGG